MVQVWICRGYTNTARDLRRIESNNRSPMIASFSELVSITPARKEFSSYNGSFIQINGIATVRAFGVERFFVTSVYKRLDRVQAASYYCELVQLI